MSTFQSLLPVSCLNESAIPEASSVEHLLQASAQSWETQLTEAVSRTLSAWRENGDASVSDCDAQWTVAKHSTLQIDLPPAWVSIGVHVNAVGHPSEPKTVVNARATVEITRHAQGSQPAVRLFEAEIGADLLSIDAPREAALKSSASVELQQALAKEGLALVSQMTGRVSQAHVK